MNDQPSTFAQLLNRALIEPGKIHQAYCAFHNYSIGNQFLALIQCAERGIKPGPLASFNRWKELGRHVIKGQRAIELCMPITCKRTIDTEGGEEEAIFTRFVFKRNWFVLAQTAGEPYTPPALPDWDKARALSALSISETLFSSLDGNCQGYASGRSIAVSPVAAMPEKTTFHEIAHVVLGHTSEGDLRDDERTPRSIREVQAEAVAMLCCAALGLPGMEFSVGYIQHWKAQGGEISEAHARQVFKAADAILKAGRVEEGQ